MCSSCLQEEYVNNSFEEKLIVEGWIEQNGVAKVMLTFGLNPTDVISEELLKDKIVRYAVVHVSDDLGNREKLVGFADPKYPTNFVYKGAAIVGRVGGVYTLEIEYGTRKWTSTTTIPAPNDLYDITVERETVNEKYMYRVKAKIKPNEDNLPYMVQCATAFTKADAPSYFRPSLFGIIESCEKENEIVINRPLDYTNIFEYSTLFLIQEDVYIRFCTMPKFGYDYWSVWENCTLNGVNPIFPVDENPPTNILGGAEGIWLGYGVSYYRVSPLPF